jgi:hypothetical protein
VCLAIGDNLMESKSVGFIWGIDGNFYWAICSECEQERLRGNTRAHDLVPLCPSCFEEAWRLNGEPEQFP